MKRGRGSVRVVLTNKNHGEFLYRSEVHSFMKRSLVDGTITEEARDNAAASFRLHGECQSWSKGYSTAHYGN